MCGIVAFAGESEAAPFLYDAIKRLEYRGYDSWGFALQNETGGCIVQRTLGAPSEGHMGAYQHKVGIAHTRWGTHGKPSVANAHPVAGGCRRQHPGQKICSPDTCWVVHNGIIKNHESLRFCLIEDGGYVFQTETDTEVIAHTFDKLSRFIKYEEHVTAELAAEAIGNMCVTLEGQYAFAIVSSRFPGYILAACFGAPLLVTKNGFLASDISALSGWATEAFRVPDGAVAVLGGPEWLYVVDRYNRPVGSMASMTVPARPIREAKKEPHEMLQEIYEQPALLRIGLFGDELQIPHPSRVVLFGCGSSYHAAMLGKNYIEMFAGVPAEVYYASEFNHRNLSYYDDETLFVAITQSGETHDTLEAMGSIVAQRGRQQTILLTNNPNSSACEACFWFIDLEVGEERGVAATKTFSLMVSSLIELAVKIAVRADELFQIAADITHKLPAAVEKLLAMAVLKGVGAYVSEFNNALYLASGLNYPVAMEGALKLKEVAYIHAEAMPAAEMKHGPIALIDEKTVSIFLLPGVGVKVDRLVANMCEIASRGGKVVVFHDEGIKAEDLPGDLKVALPSCPTYVSPILMVIALQLVAYYAAVERGLPVDRPRNLAKCVTV